MYIYINIYVYIYYKIVSPNISFQCSSLILYKREEIEALTKMRCFPNLSSIEFRTKKIGEKNMI